MVTLVVGKVQIYVNWGQREQFPKGTITKIMYPYLKIIAIVYILCPNPYCLHGR
jgi:uncharacterized protein (DUF3820 family)